MSSPREDEMVHQAIELLLDCGTAVERTRVLLETVLESGLAASAALWRQVGRGAVRAWHPVLARGQAALLPTLAELRAVVDGELDAELGRGRCVLLPIGTSEFALTLGGCSPDSEVELAESLLQVWLAVEIADAGGCSEELIDALPPLTEAAREHPTSAAARLLGRARADVPPGRELEQFLEGEAGWMLGPGVSFEVHVEDLPALEVDPLWLEALLRDLLSHAAAGQTRRSERVRVAITDTSEQLAGIQVSIEDDAGWPPSLASRPSGRRSTGLFSAAAALTAVGGSLRLDSSPLGGVRIVAWLPAA